MKKIFTLNKLKAKSFVGILLLALLLVAGCYKFRNIIQPEIASTNSSFDVHIIAQGDGNSGNDWTNPDNHAIGFFGALIPVGWNVQDSIPYSIICTDTSYNNDGILVYDSAHSQTLMDSIPPPEGYYWWGAVTDSVASLVYFDSLYFSPHIFTDNKTGTFYLRYAIGDDNYWDRNPADDLSDPIPITISSSTGVNEILSEANTSIYPNPTTDVLNINLRNLGHQVIDMSVYNSIGKVVMTKQLTQQNNTIHIESLTNGVYFVSLKNGNYTKSYKVIKN